MLVALLVVWSSVKTTMEVDARLASLEQNLAQISVKKQV